MTAAALSCSICMDDNVRIAFECRTLDCDYQMCEPCLKDVLDDPTVANTKNCPMCKETTGVRMVEAIAGKGAVRLVEHELRAAVEYNVKSDYLKKKEDRKELDSLSIKARKIFHKLSEDLTMKCPRCSMAFYDYDGCNALHCSQVDCNAAFCALCLKDCGSDAHQHIREKHGVASMFDKPAFEQSRVAREKATIERYMDELSDERFELKQMIQNQIERAKMGQTARANETHRVNTFIAESRAALKHACNMDRLSVLRDPESRDCFRGGLSRADISPRLVIPDGYRVQLVPSGGSVYAIHVSEETENGTWSHLLLEKLSDLKPAVDILMNIKQAVQCGVIAFNGARRLYQSKVVRSPKGVNLGDQDVSIGLFAVDNKGEVSDVEANDFNLEIIGINQNLRMIKLSTYVEEKSSEELAFEPLKHLVGVSKPKPILEGLSCSPPPTINELNPEQKSIAHPLCIKSAMEIAGPPGTGKTKTITELVRGLLECTTKNVVVMSERNGAIDAIAEKFASACIDSSSRRTPQIIDLNLWNMIMTFGAAATVGPSTELFTLEAKLRCHPELLLLNEQLVENRRIQSALARKMRDAIAVAISQSMRPFLTLRASTLSERLAQTLKQPCLTISYLLGAETSIKRALQRTNLQEDDIVRLSEENTELVGSLALVRSKQERERKKWDKDEAVAKLKRVSDELSKLLKTPAFNEDDARSIQSKIRDLEEQYRRAEARLTFELPRMARLQMSTIGSSHKLLSKNTRDSDESEDDLLMGFGHLEVAETSVENAVVIFDEAGCIPAYELLGLTRLESTIEALILVGDKEQLPPYQSSASFSSGRQRTQNNGQRNWRNLDSSPARALPGVKSLLDCSRLSLDSGEKVKLTTQYRVPKDIAGILNDRVYSGDYKTCTNSKVPARGLRFVGVQADPEPRKKYVNRFEVDQVLNIVLCHEGESVMILTPYKNQQREIQFQLKRLGIDEHKVLTIDQCQGQEADTVILSLVQKPTRFLNKNRLNVALSRVRQSLYFLTDKREFRKAAMNSEWDCHLMAKDLLELWGEYE